MTKLYISEYANVVQIADRAGVVVQCPEEPALATQVLDYSGGAASSSAFNASTRFVRIHTDAICAVKFGISPTAVSGTDARMAADQSEFRGIPRDGSARKVSAVTTT